jgi:hypothetical protein
VCPADAPANVKLAAKEIRRYVYLRTGKLLPMAESGQGMALKVDPALGAQEYRISTEGIAGGSDIGVLYGAYRYAELLGVRFYLHGDTIPDERLKDLPAVKEETGKPLFETRGILPFHDFPEGPDWWSTDDYRACIAQLAKMRMNFLGLHSYNWEPLVWRGVAEDVADDGSVRTSYPAGWFRSTQGNGTWGLLGLKTSAYTAGASEVFAIDDMRSPVEGAEGGPFERVARLLGVTVSDAHAVGVKVCVGTESPLHIPGPAAQRLQELARTDRPREIYRGMFTWLKKNAPVDYYWLWTPEGWIWHGNSPGQAQATADDFKAALGALEDLGSPFRLATSGWVLGPQQDRSAWDALLPQESPMANINLHVGHAPIDPAFAKIQERPKWAIPWFEGDPDKTGYQPWVGRMRYDAVDARRLGCTGLIGIHWRTKALAQNISALAQAAWDQGWAQGQPLHRPQVRSGSVATSTAPVGGTTQPTVYQSLRYDLAGYPVDVPNGIYTVVLRFNELHYGAPGKRVFGVSVEGRSVAEKLDVFARVGKDHAFDIAVPDVTVNDGSLDIDFTPVVEYPFLSAVEIGGTAEARNVIAADGSISQQPAAPFARRINVGGPAHGDYEADIAQAEDPLAGIGRSMPMEDFYIDFAEANFGAPVARDAAALLAAADGFTVPLTRVREYAGSSCWGIRLVKEPWEKMKEHYRFVEPFAALRTRIAGAGNLERFDYWANTLRASEAMMRLACLRGQLEETMSAVATAPDPGAKRRHAESALALRLELTRLHEELMRLQIENVSTPGELGTLAALEQHGSTWRQWLTKYDGTLTAALGRPLPADAQPSQAYAGKPLLTNLTRRDRVKKGEELVLNILALAKEPLLPVVVRVRPMGRGEWQTLPATHVARAVYEVKLPPASEDFEYHLAAGDHLVWPATAPSMNQTVLVREE